MLKDIAPNEAVDMLGRLPVTTETETVTLNNSHGRIAACDIATCIPVPPFDRSPFDGYAFRGEDTRGATGERPAVLRIIEEIPAGTAPTREITPGTAAKILTGAPIPNGANTTIKYEETAYTDGEVRIPREIAPNTNIVYAGEDIAPGRVIVNAGDIITPPLVATLANQGICEVCVYMKPVITIISTGTELREVGQELGPAAIYNSNVYTIGGYVKEAGADFINGGVAPDDPEQIAERISAALDASDMVITTGGASVGDYDWAIKSAGMAGARVLFWKTAMKPGGSLMAAERGGKVIFGLSGNPAAAVLGLMRIAMPYIKRLCGRADWQLEPVDVMLREPYDKGGPRLRLLRGRLVIENGAAYFAGMEAQGNGVVSSFDRCDLIGEIPVGSPPLPAGTVIKAHRI